MKLKIVTKEDLKDWTKELFQEKSFNMIDVSDKEITLRRALATGSIVVGKEVGNVEGVAVGVDEGWVLGVDVGVVVGTVVGEEVGTLKSQNY